MFLFNMSNDKKSSQTQQKVGPIAETITPVSSTPNFITQWGGYIIILFGFLLYANTLGHDYTQDDAIVIYDNMYTTKGFGGIGGLLSEDTFFGFFKEKGKAKLVSGGRYRPFTPIMFAVEYGIFGKNPFIGHLINALLYGLLGFSIWKLFSMIFGNRLDFSKHYQWIIFGVCLLFIAHPIHTEAVANIKGRDEIMAFLGSTIASIFILKYLVDQQIKNAILAFLAFFMAIMSKENAITFLAIMPAIIVFFYGKSLGMAIKTCWPLFAGAVLFLAIRTAILGLDFGGIPMELMNNPFLKLQGDQYVPFSFSEKAATIIYTLGKYAMLLLFPHPLTHDYYPRHIEIMTFGNTKVLLSLLFYIALIIASVYYYNKDRVITFSILFYITTLSIVSNIVFPIGTNMSERFVFMPSLGICLVFVHFLYKLLKSGKISFYITCFIALIFSAKTIARNQIWKDDFTLFTTDVKTSNRSAKILNAAGGTLTSKAESEKDTMARNILLKQAVGYLDQAINVHPKYANAYMIRGNALYYLGDYKNAISSYENFLKLNPDNADVIKNLAIAYRDAGRIAGEKQNDLVTAKQYLEQSYALVKTDPETVRLLGVINGISGNHSKAIEYFLKSLELQPKNAFMLLNLSNAYALNGDQVNAQKYKSMAKELDPKIGN
jgi:protein O-mannosyl-transferase